MFLLDILKVIILGIIQGVTEWLPISSTGHLILFEDLLRLSTVSDGFFDVFKVVIQLGSIIAVVVLFWKRLVPYKKPAEAAYGDGFANNAKLFAKSVAADRETWKLWLKIAVACVPAAVAGFLLEDIIDSVLSTSVVIAAALIVYGIAFLWLENRKHKVKCDSVSKLPILTAFFIGCFQMLALIPGTSRSGSTILGATALGTSRPVAAEFSFFLAVPVMFGAGALKLLHGAGGFTAAEWLLILIGSLVSFIVSLFVIRFFMDYIKKHSFVVFGWYRIILGLVILIVAGVSKLL